jgi:very-short-patch-repair endonuclease
MSLVGFPDVFRGSDAVACGALTPAQLRGPQVQRLCRDVYTSASRPVTHELRCRAVALALPAGAVITGRSAATVRGVRLCWADDDVQVLAQPQVRLGHRRGLDVRRTEIEPGDWEPWADGRLASPMRLALDLLLGRALPDAVAGLDAVVRAGLVTIDAVAVMVARRSDNGIVTARQAVALADPLAESLPESVLRVHLRLAGLDPVPQYWLEDRAGRIARVDLAFPAHKVAVEYDGDWRDGETWALNRDRERLNRVQALGWDVVFVTAPLLRDVRRMVRTVETALARST